MTTNNDQKCQHSFKEPGKMDVRCNAPLEDLIHCHGVSCWHPFVPVASTEATCVHCNKPQLKCKGIPFADGKGHKFTPRTEATKEECPMCGGKSKDSNKKFHFDECPALAYLKKSPHKNTECKVKNCGSAKDADIHQDYTLVGFHYFEPVPAPAKVEAGVKYPNVLPILQFLERMACKDKGASNPPGMRHFLGQCCYARDLLDKYQEQLGQTLHDHKPSLPVTTEGPYKTTFKNKYEYLYGPGLPEKGDSFETHGGPDDSNVEEYARYANLGFAQGYAKCLSDSKEAAEKIRAKMTELERYTELRMKQGEWRDCGCVNPMALCTWHEIARDVKKCLSDHGWGGK